MQKMQKIDERKKIVQKCLNRYFPKPKIPLHHKNTYTLLIAVLLSARCTDVMVNKVTRSLFAKASSAKEMEKLSLGVIQEIIRPCGLSPQKAKGIKKLSQILLKEYGGRVPKNFEALETLPQVGHKTASVVMAQAFKKPAFPVDTHIFRLARRWGLSKGKNVKKVEEDLKKIFPQKSWRRLHLQMIYYGRTFCPAKGHKLDKCPICSKLTKENMRKIKMS